jgi:hypothetical protein
MRVLLADKDIHLATLAAMVVLDSEGEFTADLEKSIVNSRRGSREVLTPANSAMLATSKTNL